MALIGKKGRTLSWNYRVVREVCPVPGSEETENIFTVREVFYDDDGKPELWSAEPCSPQGQTHDELRTDLGYMLMALEQPVIEMADLPGAHEVAS